MKWPFEFESRLTIKWATIHVSVTTTNQWIGSQLFMIAVELTGSSSRSICTGKWQFDSA